MTAASPHLDPAQPIQNTAGSPTAPQHQGLFLQPRYTVELPPLDEEEDDSPPASPFPHTGGAEQPADDDRHVPGRPAGT